MFVFVFCLFVCLFVCVCVCVCVQVYVKAGIYHGRESLCPVVTTSKGASSEGAEWNEILEFDIPIRDVPRGAKLCFIVFAAPER